MNNNLLELAKINDQIKEKSNRNTDRDNAVGNLDYFLSDEVSYNESLEEIFKAITTLTNGKNESILKETLEQTKNELELQQKENLKKDLIKKELEIKKSNLLEEIKKEYSNNKVRVFNPAQFKKGVTATHEMEEISKTNLYISIKKYRDLIIIEGEKELIEKALKSAKYLKNSAHKIDKDFPLIENYDRLSLVYVNGSILNLNEIKESDFKIKNTVKNK